MKGKRGPRPAAKEAPKPKQQRLPGTEDAKIDALEDKAEEYADVRDKRLRIGAEEVELKKQLLDLMKANKKEVYRRGNIEITITHEEESVKVRIEKDE